jgi:hypothetical protein
MQKPIQAKKGSSLFEAAFSLAESARVTVFNFGEIRTLQFNPLKLNCKPSFSDLINAARESEFIHVENDSLDRGVIEVDRFVMDAFVKQCTHSHERLRTVKIFTAQIQRVRELAKEYRTDRAVARAAKKPSKPKADIKTRKDIM